MHTNIITIVLCTWTWLTALVDWSSQNTELVFLTRNTYIYLNQDSTATSHQHNTLQTTISHITPTIRIVHFPCVVWVFSQQTLNDLHSIHHLKQRKMIRSTDSQTDTSHISTNRIRINDKYSLNTCVTTYFLGVSALQHKNDSGTFKLTHNFELTQHQPSQTFQ